MEWNTIPGNEIIETTAAAAGVRGFDVTVVDNRDEALRELIASIPEGAELMNGSSTTLHEIGFTDYLKENGDRYSNLHDAILAETDPAKQGELRRKSVTADYFLASINAIAQTGELFACDASGSRVGAYPFAANHLILVSGVNKIVPTWDDGIRRLREFAYPLEDKRAQEAYGMHSSVSKIVIMEQEFVPGRIKLILVKEKLGF